METFVGIDLGASNTRFVSDDAKIYEMDNNIKEIGIDEEIRIKPWVANTYEEVVLGSLDVEIDRLEGDTPHIKSKARYLVGKLADRLGASSTPNGLQNKASQSINYTNALLAAGLSKLFLNTDGDITLYVGLPPVELSTKSKSEKQFKEEFIGNYVVKFRANVNKVVNFRIINVVCIEESFLTLASFFFKPQGGFRPEAKPYIKGNVLGIDIGASTTDLAVMKDCRFVEKTGQTYKVGGNYVLDMIADGIRAEFGYDPEKDELQKAVETGVIDQGSDVIDISSLVEEAKKEFAIKLVNMMQGYFTKIAMQPHTFKVVVVGGGGSMKSSYVSENGVEVETSHPMSEYIWNEFKMICPSVPVVQVSTDPRHANITGLYIRAIVDKISNQKVVPAVPELQQTKPVNEGMTELRVNF